MISDTGRLMAERACERLVARYSIAADFGDIDTAIAQYAEHGRLTVAGKTYEGRDAIRKRLADQPAGQISRHLVSCVLVDVLGAERARGWAYVAIYRGTAVGGTPAVPMPIDLPFLVGHYEDSFILTSDGWRFDERRLVTTFRRSA